jgi:thiol-disulfide isomerase/thioredoxin
MKYKVLNTFLLAALSVLYVVLVFFVSGVLLIDYSEIGVLTDCSFFLFLNLLFFRVLKHNPLYAWSMYIPAIAIVLAMLFVKLVHYDEHLVENIELFSISLLTLCCFLIYRIGVKWMMVFGVIFSLFMSFVVYPKSSNQNFLDQSTQLSLDKLNLKKINLVDSDSVQHDFKKLMTQEHVVIFGFNNCAPCREIKRDLLQLATKDTSLRNALIFITNGQIDNFKQFKQQKHQEYGLGLYDQDGLLSSYFVPENKFPTLVIFTRDRKARKYYGYSPIQKKAVYELVKSHL